MPSDLASGRAPSRRRISAKRCCRFDSAIAMWPEKVLQKRDVLVRGVGALQGSA